MKKLTIVSLVALLVVLPVMLSAKDVNVSGAWKMTTKSPRGERTSDITFKQEGEKLTVTSKNMRGEETTSEGTVKGMEIEWTLKMTTQRGTMEIVYKGTISGDSMKGTAKMGDRGEMEWSAVKAQ